MARRVVAATIAAVWKSVARVPPFAQLIRLATGAFPVLERDYLVYTSTWKFVATRVGIIALPVICLILFLLEEVVGRQYGLQRVSKYVFVLSVAFVPALLALVGLAVGASSISTERSQHTLPLVLSAPIGPLALVLAKFVSRSGVVLICFMGMLPVIAICMLYPGISPGLFAQFIVYTATSALLAVACGVCASAFARRVVAAVVGAFVLWLLAVGGHTGVQFALWIYELNTVPHPGGWDHWVILWDGFLQCVALAVAGERGGRPLAAGFEPALWTLGVAALFLAVATWRMSRENAGGGRRKRKTRVRPLRFEDPVFDRAVRGSLGYRTAGGAWVELGLFVLLFGIGWWAAIENRALDDGEFHAGMLCGATGLMCLSVLVRSSQLIAAERSTGALELLRVTAMTDRSVIFAKVNGVLRTQRWFVVFLLAYCGLAALVSDFRVVQSLLVWVPCTFVLMNACALLGAHVSCRIKRPGAAILTTLLTFAGWCLFLILCVWLAEETVNENELTEFLLIGEPFVLPTIALVELQDWGFFGMRPRHSLACMSWTGAYLIAISYAWRALPSAFRRVDDA